jgi:predicted esterase
VTNPVEGHLRVTRTARYWSAGGGDEVEELWVVLHGYKQLARRFLRRFEPIADEGRWVVAPEGLSRFYTDPQPGRHGPASAVGASWMTREDRENEIQDYVAYLDQLREHLSRGASARLRVVVLGFSQGVATACRWLTRGRTRAHRLILWGDFLPPDLDLREAAARLAGTDVVLVRGDTDAVLTDARLRAEEEARVSEGGIELRLVTYPGGHEIDVGVLGMLTDASP